jgi:phosphoenolpyruvate---glycerone phosphotransferase subunit DhaL
LILATTAMDSATVTTWMGEIAGAVRAERDYLVQLDAAIGDGDHGINMTRGFDAVVRALAAEDDAPPGRLLTLAGKTLVSSVGGASGPLWGSALRRAGRALGDAPTFEAPSLVAAMEAALAAIVDLGAATPGDKTMVDALDPAISALREGVVAGQSLQVALRQAADAAERGMRATIPLQARKGRASYLGERSIGHQDPGATSAALVMRALERTVAGED